MQSSFSSQRLSPKKKWFVSGALAERPIGHPRCTWEVGFGNQQFNPCPMHSPQMRTENIDFCCTWHGREWISGQLFPPSFSLLQPLTHPTRGVSFSYFYDIICYALGGVRCSFVLGCPPSSISGRQLQCWWCSLLPWRVNEFHPPIVAELGFPRTCGGAGSLSSAKGLLPGNRAIH